MVVELVTEVGFIGVGIMGSPIAAHLVRAGHRVRVHDRVRTAAKMVEDAGAHFASSPAEAADGADFVFLSLPGPAQVREIISGDRGILSAVTRPGYVIDLSTNGVEDVRAIRTQCDAVGMAFLDAPVSGGKVKALAGTLSVMVGGTSEEFEAVEPLLQIFGEQIFHVGGPGLGTIAKLVNNQIFLSAGLLVQEAFLLADAHGMDLEDLRRVLRSSSAGPYIFLAPLLLSRTFDDAIFRMDIAAKDLELAVDSAGAVGARLPVTESASKFYREAVASGLGDQVFHATLRLLEQHAGTELAPLDKPSRTSGDEVHGWKK